MRINLQDDSADAEVQMAPLIDCVFLLLIFFLLATTLKTTAKELPVELPVSVAAVEKTVEPELLILGVDKYGQKYIGAEPVGNDMLLTRIRVAAGAGVPIRVDADRNARWEDVVQVIELCQFEGIRNVGYHVRKDSK